MKAHRHCACAKPSTTRNTKCKKTQSSRKERDEYLYLPVTGDGIRGQCACRGSLGPRGEPASGSLAGRDAPTRRCGSALRPQPFLAYIRLCGSETFYVQALFLETLT